MGGCPAERPRRPAARLLLSHDLQEFIARVRRQLTGALGSIARAFAFLGVGTASATPAAADPCGFCRTSSDAYYNHCTSDGSRVVIEVEVAMASDYKRCVGPGTTWLGSASKIQGAYHVGRTC
jgi:hypothetical protein